MSRIVVSEFLSLDGVMETPEKWVFDFINQDINKFKLDEVLAGDALLLGYATYQIFANSWPTRKDPEGFANKMNSMPKYVVTKSTEALAWNNSLRVQGDLASAVSRLKQQSRQDVLVAGSSVLVQALMQQHLIDEYRFLVYPIVLGKVKRLFKDGATAGLKLTEAKTFDTGVILLRYEPSAKT
jgi:dihydrofolate reductase